ncbi:pyridoxal phosphate-dependent decarboxylase family protein [Acanthopleuribacter pedis]|uniref:Uncharacterized protein n=1 Tax=Acanthopleuribacter pedis TaxID=442870 RepID=A0A8J7QHU8_9BACT|nr:pyridoxal-dependent decarboxylase [Acanthopleuribacter pedis]MBO1322725.1 hypothetical protein [Acanthopleuribacter pedis]
MKDFHTEPEIRAYTRRLDDLLIDYYVDPARDPLLNYTSKPELAQALNEPDPPREGIGLDQALQLFETDILANSVKTWHPGFMNQMSAGASFPAVMGAALAAMMNGTLSTFEASPAATIIEHNVARWMAELLGMKPGSGGIFLPGSSLGNFLALVVARNNQLADSARHGMHHQDAVVLCSDAAHYSVANAVNLMGLGRESMVTVATNEANEILIEDFAAKIERCLAQGKRPFAAVATLGLTVTGGFDPIAEMAELCSRYDMHLHADAAFGGGMALTDRRDRFMQGIEAADTVTWDAHKWLHAPLTCTVLLSPNPHVFKQTFNPDAPYLFHDFDEQTGVTEDLGHFTPLCGKQFHALPVWLMLKAYGSDWFRHQAQTRLTFLDDLTAAIKNQPHFELAYEPRSPVLCFRYLPRDGHADAATLNQLQVTIREKIRASGKALFNVTDIKGTTYFRLILINPLMTMAEAQPLLHTIASVGASETAALRAN